MKKYLQFQTKRYSKIDELTSLNMPNESIWFNNEDVEMVCLIESNKNNSSIMHNDENVKIMIL